MGGILRGVTLWGALVGGAFTTWQLSSSVWDMLWGIKQAQVTLEITMAKNAIAVNNLTMALNNAKEDRMKENAEQTAKIQDTMDRVKSIEGKVGKLETSMEWLIWQRRGELPGSLKQGYN